MLVSVGEERTAWVDLGLAVWLSGIAGAINAVGFHAVGFFSANMTGNFSSLSDHLALGRLALVGVLAGVVIAFLGGAFCSAVVVEAGKRRSIKGIYANLILLEGFLISALALGDLILAVVHSGPLLAVGLSFAMGLQNATTTLISNARVRTTHVSGMATDLGIELASLASKDRSSGPLMPLLRLHGLTLLAFLVGVFSAC